MQLLSCLCLLRSSFHQSLELPPSVQRDSGGSFYASFLDFSFKINKFHTAIKKHYDWGTKIFLENFVKNSLSYCDLLVNDILLVTGRH